VADGVWYPEQLHAREQNPTFWESRYVVDSLKPWPGRLVKRLFNFCDHVGFDFSLSDCPD
jgi:hypothetical protein